MAVDSFLGFSGYQNISDVHSLVFRNLDTSSQLNLRLVDKYHKSRAELLIYSTRCQKICQITKCIIEQLNKAPDIDSNCCIRKLHLVQEQYSVFSKGNHELQELYFQYRIAKAKIANIISNLNYPALNRVSEALDKIIGRAYRSSEGKSSIINQVIWLKRARYTRLFDHADMKKSCMGIYNRTLAQNKIGKHLNLIPILEAALKTEKLIVHGIEYVGYLDYLYSLIENLDSSFDRTILRQRIALQYICKNECEKVEQLYQGKHRFSHKLTSSIAIQYARNKNFSKAEKHIQTIHDIHRRASLIKKMGIASIRNEVFQEYVSWVMSYIQEKESIAIDIVEYLLIHVFPCEAGIFILHAQEKIVDKDISQKLEQHQKLASFMQNDLINDFNKNTLLSQIHLFLLSDQDAIIENIAYTFEQLNKIQSVLECLSIPSSNNWQERFLKKIINRRCIEKYFVYIDSVPCLETQQEIVLSLATTYLKEQEIEHLLPIFSKIEQVGYSKKIIKIQEPYDLTKSPFVGIEALSIDSFQVIINYMQNKISYFKTEQGYALLFAICVYFAKKTGTIEAALLLHEKFTTEATFHLKQEFSILKTLMEAYFIHNQADMAEKIYADIMFKLENHRFQSAHIENKEREKEVFNAIEEHSMRCIIDTSYFSGLTSIANRLIEEDRIDEVKNIISKIQVANAKDEVLSVLVQPLIEQNNFFQAREFAALIENPDIYKKVFEYIAQEEAGYIHFN